MSELTKAARPYAKAVFDLAQETGELDRWSEMLAFGAAVVSDPEMQARIEDPAMTGEQLTELLLAICSDKFNEQAVNLSKLLIENDRLVLFPAIAERFETLRQEQQGKVTARVVSAKELTETEQQKLAQKLTDRLNAEVSIETEVDDSLLGGAIIYAGDLVIDGSIRGRLDNLATSMSR